MQGKERIKRERTESAHLATGFKDKKRKRGKEAAAGTSQHKVQKKQDEVFACYFYKKAGHMKKDCPKYANWRVKKGMLLALVCSEVNLASVPRHIWWIDSNATTHISVSMQGCLWS